MAAPADPRPLLLVVEDDDVLREGLVAVLVTQEVLLRVPGLGVRNVKRILATRKQRKLRYDDLVKLRCDVGKAKAFVTTIDWRPMNDSQSSDRMRSTMTTSAAQLELL